MSYVDGFVIPVPANNKQAYRDMAAKVAPLFKKYGATRVVECWGDDVPDGKVTDFKGAVKAEAGEIVVFSWVVWPSKEVRDAGNKKFMEDPLMKEMADEPHVFDGKRMIIGGFEVLIDELQNPGSRVDRDDQAEHVASAGPAVDLAEVVTNEHPIAVDLERQVKQVVAPAPAHENRIARLDLFVGRERS